MQLHFFFFFVVNGNASNFPIGYRITAHLFHKEQREFEKKWEGGFSPGPQLKLPLAKWQLFIPGFPNVVSPDTLNKLRERSNGSRLLETKSQEREEGGNEMLEDGKSKKAISHALVRIYGIISNVKTPYLVFRVIIIRFA